MTSDNYIENIALDIRHSVPQDILPDQDATFLFLLYAVLALTKGQAVDRRDVHNAWSAWMTTQNPEHESIAPYEELPASVQHEDDPFVEAIRRVARRL